MALVLGSISNYVEDDYVASGYMTDAMHVSASTTIAGVIPNFVYGTITNYVADDYVADGYMTEAIHASASTTIDAVLNPVIYTYGSVSLQAEFASSISAEVETIIEGAVALTTEFTQSASAVLNPLLEAELSLTTQFTQDTTATNFITLEAEGKYGWADVATWDNWDVWQNTWLLTSQFNQSTGDSGIVHTAGVNVSSALTWDASIVGTRVGDIDCIVNATMSDTATVTQGAIISASVTFGSSINAYNLKSTSVALDTSVGFTATPTIIQSSALSIDCELSKTCTSNVSQSAELTVSSDTTYTCTISGVLTTEINCDVTATQTTDPGLLIGADLPVGLLTNWSALGSPFLGTTVAVPFTFNSTVVSAVTQTTTITPSAEFSSETNAGLIFDAELTISSAMTSSLVARVYTTDPTRYLTVQPESRTIIVKQETRTLQVPIKPHLREAA